MATENLMSITGMQDVLSKSALDIWASFIDIVPGIIAAFIVLVLGWVVGKVLGGAARKLLNKAKLDHWVETHNLSKALYGMHLSAIVGSMVKWYIILMFLTAVASLVKLAALATIVTYMVLYIPALLGSALVVLAAMLLGEHLKNTALATKARFKKPLGAFLKWIVIYFGLVIGLQTTGFEVQILIDAFRIGFSAFALATAIIAGIGFGLAFKDDFKTYATELKHGAKSFKG